MSLDSVSLGSDVTLTSLIDSAAIEQDLGDRIAKAIGHAPVAALKVSTQHQLLPHLLRINTPSFQVAPAAAGRKFRANLKA